VIYALEIKPTADKIFRKLSKKNPKQLKIISKKVTEIREKPDHNYKHLKKPLEDFYRVHIDKNFVLIFDIDHLEEAVIIYYFDHHDNVYEWRPRTVDDK
jgi:YafQ family addiction module toxin component